MRKSFSSILDHIAINTPYKYSYLPRAQHLATLKNLACHIHPATIENHRTIPNSSKSQMDLELDETSNSPTKPTNLPGAPVKKPRKATKNAADDIKPVKLFGLDDDDVDVYSPPKMSLINRKRRGDGYKITDKEEDNGEDTKRSSKKSRVDKIKPTSQAAKKTKAKRVAALHNL